MGLPLAAIAVALFVMSLGNGVPRVHAAVDSSVNFSISSTGCDSDGTATCNVSAGSSFSVAFNITSLPNGGTYDEYHMSVSWPAGLQGPTPGSPSPGIHQHGAGNWPDCPTLTNFMNTATATTANADCATTGNESSYTGGLLHMDFRCPTTNGTFIISLNHGDDFNSGTWVRTAPLPDVHNEAAAPAHEDLTINCVESVNFSITSTGCDSDGTATCNVSAGNSFSVAFNITSLPTGGTYNEYHMNVSWPAGLTGPAPGSPSPGIHQHGAGNWPDCPTSTNFMNTATATTASADCATTGNDSSYTGGLLHMDFQCPSTAGTFIIRLNHGDDFNSGTWVRTAPLPNVHNEAAAPAHEDLTINCGAAPTASPNAVGGLVALSVSSSGSSIPWTPLAVVAAGVMAVLGVGFWYGRRRWSR